MQLLQLLQVPGGRLGDLGGETRGMRQLVLVAQRFRRFEFVMTGFSSEAGFFKVSRVNRG